ncbi:hypothetical protein BX666DRAFT_1813383, partial [Dichotomocladium elegans]
EAKCARRANEKKALAEDFLRLARHSKDLIDCYDMEAVLALQIVGHHVTCYITTLACEGTYVIIEAARFKVPSSKDTLSAFTLSFTTILRIIHVVN